MLCVSVLLALLVVSSVGAPLSLDAKAHADTPVHPFIELVRTFNCEGVPFTKHHYAAYTMTHVPDAFKQLLTMRYPAGLNVKLTLQSPPMVEVEVPAECVPCELFAGATATAYRASWLFGGAMKCDEDSTGPASIAH